jgi:hypothetical protein
VDIGSISKYWNWLVEKDFEKIIMSTTSRPKRLVMEAMVMVMGSFKI